MAFEIEVSNAAVDGATATLAQMSLHTADPGSTGANEVSGGSYARATGLTWNGAASGSDQVQESIPVPGGTTVTHVGLWEADGTTWRGGFQAGAGETWNNDGTADVTFTVTS